MILWCRSAYPDSRRNAAVARVAHMAFKLAGVRLQCATDEGR